MFSSSEPKELINATNLVNRKIPVHETSNDIRCIISIIFYFLIWPVSVSFVDLEHTKITSRNIYLSEATALNDFISERILIKLTTVYGTSQHAPKPAVVVITSSFTFIN